MYQDGAAQWPAIIRSTAYTFDTVDDLRRCGSSATEPARMAEPNSSRKKPRMTVLYSTKVAATGGRKGKIRSEDNTLDLRLAIPKRIGRYRRSD